jgi:hypothetical protein
MNFAIKKNEKPPLEKAHFLVDYELSPKLNKFELTKYLNMHSSNLIIGPPRSGKTSFLYALFSKALLKKCYHKIFLFMAKNSQDSIKDNKFLKLPENQRFSELSFDNLQTVIDEIKSNSFDEDNAPINYCIIIDDMTTYLKNADIQQSLKELFFNRRHLHVSLYILSQTYKSIPPDIRKCIVNWWVFRVPRISFLDLFNDNVSSITNKKVIDALYNFCYNDRDHSFLMINVDHNKFFLNWDEIILNIE